MRSVSGGGAVPEPWGSDDSRPEVEDLLQGARVQSWGRESFFDGISLGLVGAEVVAEDDGRNTELLVDGPTSMT